MKYESTKIIELGSCAFRQFNADSHCRFIHGYRLMAKFWFGCTGLDYNGWVVDFGGLKDLKNILEKQFDHTLCIAGSDPLLPVFKQLQEAGGCDLRIMENGVGIERFTEFCFNTADSYIREKTVGRCWVEKVEVFEHELNSGITRYNTADILPSHRDPMKAVPHVSHVDPKEKSVITPAEESAQPTQPSASGPRPVPIRNPVTTGWSNPFAGTSWGV